MRYEYLKISNLNRELLTDEDIEKLLKFMNDDNRVELVEKTDKFGFLNVSIDFGNGEILKGVYSYGRIAGQLYECSHEIKLRLEQEKIQLAEELQRRKERYNEKIDDLREQIDDFNTLHTSDITLGTVKEVVCKLINGRRLTRCELAVSEIVCNEEAWWNQGSNGGWNFILSI